MVVVVYCSNGSSSSSNNNNRSRHRHRCRHRRHRQDTSLQANARRAIKELINEGDTKMKKIMEETRKL